jgi:7 transmembrane receptor (rhodopsin family)
VLNLKAFKISVAIVVSFVVCWLPLQTFMLLYYLVPAVREAPASRAQRSAYGAAYFACHYLACANSFLNPLLYCFMNKNFRVRRRQATCSSTPHICHLLMFSGRPARVVRD